MIQTPTHAAGIVATLLLGLVPVLAPPAARAADPPPIVPNVTGSLAARDPPSQEAPAAPWEEVFAVGDTLRVSFYEELDLAPDASAGMALTTFYQRVDLTGDYEIDAGGTVSIPTLGSFATWRRSVAQLEREIAEEFAQRTGRGGDVHVRIVARQPIYVMGAVRAPGAYAYAPGMVALHAIALGGGLDKAPAGSERLLDARREAERQATAEERLKRLLARRARLAAERDNGEPAPPPRLEEIAGEEEARALIAAEVRMGESAAAARRGEIALQDAHVAAAEGELAALRDSIARVEAQIAVRSERVAELEAVQAKGFGNTEILASARKEVSDHELSRSRLEGEIHRAERALVEAGLARERVLLETRAQIERELMAVEDEIAQLEHTVRAAAEIGRALGGGAPRAGDGAEAAMRIEIVRRSALGTSPFDADEYVELRPGDVINVVPGPSRRPPPQAVADGRTM
jgi:exopolysaccharide production protein ExoF